MREERDRECERERVRERERDIRRRRRRRVKKTALIFFGWESSCGSHVYPKNKGYPVSNKLLILILI